MATPDAELVAAATAAINQDRTFPENMRYPVGALARSAVDAVLAPENRDALLAALGARRVGSKTPGSRLLHDDPRHAPPAGSEPVYAISDPREFS